jgi:PAS domain S-box-containing protein
VDEPIASDEIGVLQTGVNSMVATLHQTIEALEQRVNELHEAREALYTSESRFKSLIENSYDGILLYNKEGIIQYASPSIKQILGYTAEELIGKKDSDLTAEADTAEVKTIFANLRAQPGKGTAFRQRIKHKDGTLVWLEVTGTNLLYDPHVNAIVWNFRNITKRVEQEKQIQQQERLAAVGQLAAGIAHDFNNILAVIVLYSQLALKNNQLPQALQKHLQVVAEQAQRAADLVVQILDFSRRAILERRPMDLGALLKEMVKLWRRTLPENITVSLEQDTNTPLINADPTRIQQVFMNLAVNARDAMPDGGRLHIRIEQRDLEPGSHNLPDVAPGRWVQVAVADTGIGVAPEAITRLFEPFYSTKGAKGTGLGLAQVYGIVKQHEGHIGVTSQLGEGTTFTILLPPVAQTETTAVKKSGDIVVEGGGETILLVEDEKALRDALAYGLQTINYRVISAENGQDALSVYSETDENVALVLCDMVMPQMGGMKLLHQFRVKGLTLPFIIMTGHPFEADLSGLQAEGLTDWILKPVDLKSLSHLLVRALHQEQQPDTA